MRFFLFLRVGLLQDLKLVLFFIFNHQVSNCLGETLLDKKTRLGTILTMAIEDGEEVLMEGLAHVGRENKIILVFLVCIIDTEAFSR